jgi:hypothetical protein
MMSGDDVKSWLSAANDGITALALLAGGAFTYFRFVRGRALHANLDLELAVVPQEVAGCEALVVDVIIKNTGTMRLSFPLDCDQILTLAPCGNDLWTRKTEDGYVKWREQDCSPPVDVVTENGARLADQMLEPGETFKNTLMVEVEDQNWVVCNVALKVAVRSSSLWSRFMVAMSTRDGSVDDLVFRTNRVVVKSDG